MDAVAEDTVNNSTIFSFISQCVDSDYSIWLLTPLLFPVLVQVLFALMVLLCIVICNVFKLYHRFILRLPDGDGFQGFDTARTIVGWLWTIHGRIFHGYEVCGLENLPKTGPGLIIYYHGALPIDMYYLVSSTFHTQSRREIHTVGDRFLEKIPGWSVWGGMIKLKPHTIQSCADSLKEGNLLAIAPGGLHEAQFGGNNYELHWRRRAGFVKVAIESKAPIIPMFTENLREGYRTIDFARSLFLWLNTTFRFPFRPVYGGFPVKFRTHLGAPIPYDPSLTPEQLQEKVELAVKALIKKHQRIPGSILQGLKDRFVARPAKSD